MEDPLGIHYIIELYGCNSSVLDNLPEIENALNYSADIAGATIISSKFHKFSPQGVSGVVVIAESHLSIHTWPELGYAALDLYTCNLNMDIDRALEHIKNVFLPKEMIVKYMERGIMNPAKRKYLEVKDYEFEKELMLGGKK
ncbi:MAG: adenosylmethionine decarboxylase [Leptospiraceae bacterium]|nr:adenosylmethionine decarboxylase [Leptospiraceae bacterium]MDW7975112.1 adenosylmethionine decarboxylase [Leptospiraceae bacterium]